MPSYPHLKLSYSVAPSLSAQVVFALDSQFLVFHLSFTGKETYIRVVGDETQGSGNGNHVDEREEGMTRGPAEVLVAVCVEFCGLLSACFESSI